MHINTMKESSTGRYLIYGCTWLLSTNRGMHPIHFGDELSHEYSNRLFISVRILVGDDYRVGAQF